MRAELYRPEEPEAVLASAMWDRGAVRIEPAAGAPEGLADILRPTPIVVEDPSLRRLGTHGETLLQPGTLEWFRSALLTRAAAFGLEVRFVPGVRAGGWDPAAQYRSFEDQIERLGSSDA